MPGSILRAKVALKLPQDGRRRLTGSIVSVDAGTIVFDVDGETIEVPVDNIDKARLVPDWAALGYGPARELPGDGRPGKPGRKAAGRRTSRPRD